MNDTLCRFCGKPEDDDFHNAAIQVAATECPESTVADQMQFHQFESWATVATEADLLKRIHDHLHSDHELYCPEPVESHALLDEAGKEVERLRVAIKDAIYNLGCNKRYRATNVLREAVRWPKIGP